MRRSKVISGAMLLGMLVLAGCGSGSPATAKEPARVAFKSAAIAEHSIPVRYTCHGSNVSPPVEWGAVPAGTGQLALFVVSFTPEPATNTYKISVDWAVAGINPALHKLAAGRLPPGAIVGRASNGKRRYSVCPEKGAKGTSEQYQFELYGLPASVTVPPNFNGLAVLSAITGPSSTTRATAHGAFVTSYQRG